MKKIDWESKIKTEKLRKSRTNHNNERKSRKYNEDRLAPTPKVLGARFVFAPEIVQFGYEEHHKALHFIAEILHWCKVDKVVIDFSKCRGINVQTLVYLYAHLEIVASQPDSRLIRINQKSLTGRVRTTIEASGLRNMLLNKKPNSISPDCNQMPILSGVCGEDFPHDLIIDHIQKNIKNRLTPQAEQTLGDALSETFLNIADHAYPDGCGVAPPSKQWWSMCSLINDHLYLAIYDAGVGIPATIGQEHWLVQKLTKRGVNPTIISNVLRKDARKIKLAIATSANRRNAQKHGQGGLSIRELVTQSPEGSLWVYSGSGMYSLKSFQASTKNFNASIAGTLVQWTIAV